MKRIVLLRLFSIVALAASGVLMSDALHPDRGFCPLEAGCAAAAESPLGRLFGFPTSAFGAAAFGLFFLLTLLPAHWVRRVLRPAGLTAASFAVVLVGYQLLALKGVCEFCLAADASAIAIGFTVLAWKPSPEWRAPPEHMAVRVRWLLVGTLAIAVPFLLPRPERPSWVPLPESAGVAETPPPLPDPVRGFEVLASAPGSGQPSAGREVTIVEYLNPYCGHCRKTHGRLEQVRATYPIPTRIVRVYVWGTPEPPLWVRACVCAGAQGKEQETFAALLKTRDAAPETIWAAVASAGVDVAACSAAVDRGEGTERLASEKKKWQSARLEGMPTFDIGRRRLQGEQSEGEIREALDAAAALLPRPGN